MKCRFLLCSTNLVLPMQDEVFVCYRTQRMRIPTNRESIAVSVRNNWTMICRHGAALLFMNVASYLSKSRLTKLWWVNCFSNRWNGSEWQIRGLKSSKTSQHHHKDVWLNSVCFHPLLVRTSPVHHHFLRFSTLFTHLAFELAMIQQRLFKAELKGQWIACFNLSIVRTELHFSLRRCISTTSTLVHAALWRQPDNSSRRRSVTLTAVCVGLFIFPLPAVDQETLLGRSAVSQKKEGKQCVCEHLNMTRSSVCIWQRSPFRASRSRPFLWLLNESVPGWALRGHSGDELS